MYLLATMLHSPCTGYRGNEKKRNKESKRRNQKKKEEAEEGRERAGRKRTCMQITLSALTNKTAYCNDIKQTPLVV